MTLFGRDAEVALIANAVELASVGTASVLTFVGEPGIGKTSLLDAAAEFVRDGIVLRAAGIESECDLAYGALHALLRPILPFLDDVSESQADALRGALALGPPTGADRLAVAVATLQLIAAAATPAPLLILLDDIQWFDPTSRDAVVFALRRLDADGVTVVLGTRPFEALGGLGLQLVELAPLSESDSNLVLMSSGVVESVAPEISRRAAGNPLTLHVVAESLSERQRHGLDPVGEFLDLGASATRLFERTIAALPGDARTALLVAALSHSQDRALVVAACDSLDVKFESLVLAESADLVVLQADSVRLRHALTRSAVVDLASAASRRAVHRVLAVHCDDEHRPWHLAEAADGPDDGAAQALDIAAFTAFGRGDPASASRIAARAAQLSVDRDGAARRWLLAAQAASLAGLPHANYSENASDVGDADTRAEAVLIDAFVAATIFDAVTMERVVHDELRWVTAHNSLLGAIVSAFVGAYAATLGDFDTVATMVDEIHRLLPHTVDLVHPMSPAVELGAFAWRGFFGPVELSESARARQTVRAAAATQIVAPMLLGHVVNAELATGVEFGIEQFFVAERRGDIAGAGWISAAIAALELARGDLRAARSWALRSRPVLELIGAGYPLVVCETVFATIAGFRGDVEECEALVRKIGSVDDRLVWGVECANYALGMALFGAGRLDEAQRLFATIVERLPCDRAYGAAALLPARAALVETLVRSGRVDEARSHRRFFEQALASGHRGVRGHSQLALALLADNAEVQHQLFADAVATFLEFERHFDAARARLTFGEYLRRVGDRQRAIEQLTAARDFFAIQECRPWHEQVEGELSAAGVSSVSSRRLRPSLRAQGAQDVLTPQELRVAEAVALGMSNREVAAALFLSVKTIEMHLGRVFRKLGVRNRAELARRAAVTPFDS